MFFNRKSKQIVLTVILGLFLLQIGGLFAWSDDLTSVASMEQKLFNRDFSTDAPEARLARLENVIFGNPQSGSITTREHALQGIIDHTTPSNTSTTTAKQPPTDTQNGEATSDEPTAAPATKDATNYPTVSLMEQRLFQTTYENEGIATRLVRLEKRVFNQSYDELPMVDRVDQLTLKVLPDNALATEESGALPNSPAQAVPNSPAVYAKLNALEEQILGRSHGGELIGSRLNRLETRVYGHNQPGTIDMRLNRLLAQYNQTSVPNQQASAGQPQAYIPNNYPPQVSIGSFTGGNVQMSQEMMQMLPANIQQKLQSSGSVSTATLPPDPDFSALESGSSNSAFDSSRTSAGSDQWQQSQSGGFIAPNSASLYGRPGRYSTPGAFSAGPINAPYQPYQQQQQPYTQSAAALPGQYGGGYNTANSGMTLVQSISVVEQQVFGRTFDNQNIVMRLTNLEQQVFHHTYPQMTFQQRIGRLIQQTSAQSQVPPRGYQNGVVGQSAAGFNASNGALNNSDNDQTINAVPLP